MQVDVAIKKYLSYMDWSKLYPEIEYVRLLDVQGRVLAQDISSPVNIPPFARAAMDGYAVKSRDTKNASNTHPAVLVTLGRLTAGQKTNYKIESGESIEIATGAKLPEGADAVVMVEHTSAKKNKIMIYNEIKNGDNISISGEDVKKFQPLLKKGVWLTSQDVGLIAAVGIDRIPVFKKPRVAVIATGDELVEPGSKLDGVSIFESNRYMISSMISEYGGEPIDLGLCKDDKVLISSKLKKALKYDMIVVCGGTSVGKTDYVPDLVNAMGKPGLIIRGVAMKPGSPTGLGLVNETPILLAPGFPVSSFIAFYVFGRFLLLKMLQTEGPSKIHLIARMSKSITVHKNMRTFVRVNVTKKIDSANKGNYVAEPISATGARLISTLTNSNGMVIVDNKNKLKKGEKVEVIPLRNIYNM